MFGVVLQVPTDGVHAQDYAVPGPLARELFGEGWKLRVLE
jgi:hypothetical protein